MELVGREDGKTPLLFEAWRLVRMRIIMGVRKSWRFGTCYLACHLSGLEEEFDLLVHERGMPCIDKQTIESVKTQISLSRTPNINSWAVLRGVGPL